MPLRPRRLITLLLVCAWSLAPARAAEAADFPRAAEAARARHPGAQAILVVHYRRPDGRYGDWNLWAWPSGGDGASFPFSGSDTFGRWAVVPFAKRPEGAGFIVRLGDWKAKDVDGDRGVSFAQSPVQEVWLLAGDPTVHTDPGAIDLAPRLKGAFLDASDRVTLAASQPLSAEQLRGVKVTVRGDAKSAPRVKSARPSTAAGAGALYDLQLSTPVQELDVGALQVEVPKLATAAVFARGALDEPRFTPLDARLAADCGKDGTRFSTWSPVAERVDLLLFEGAATAPTRTLPLQRGTQGIWSVQVPGDLHGTRYRYRFRSYGKDREVPDIHGVAATPDSAFSVVADLSRLDPPGWADATPPQLARPTDEVIYELHVRDFSIRDESCPAAERGTYLGLLHRHPAADAQPSTGLSHLQDLGVTAVHLLPIHDFTARPDEYNWGYWTALFNVPESNYATGTQDPLQPERDFKQAVAGLHRAGIRVVMDVVYNHTSSTGESSPFDQTVPFFWHRTAPDGTLLNDTGVGNVIADERPMVRKFIVDSLEHWLRDYRVDGFRFDLLGTHTPETVRAVCERLVPLRRDITLYGEPWTGGGPTRFGKGAQRGLRMAVFNDDLRNAVRGDLDGTGTGFATGGGDREGVKRGVMGEIDAFAAEPTETVNYVSAHDNLTLWDKLLKAQPSADDAARRAMQKLAMGVVLTSQGIPLLHGGCDFARTKGGNRDSYNAGDAVNAFDWGRKAQYRDVHDYVRGLVALRRAHPAFRMADDAQVRAALRFFGEVKPVIFTLDGRAAGDAWGTILVAYNGEAESQSIPLPQPGDWNVVVDDRRAGVDTIGRANGVHVMPPRSMVVMWKP